MNSLALYQNIQAENNITEQTNLDTTANMEDPYRPVNATAMDAKMPQHERMYSAFYHFLFVGLFLFGGIVALGMLTNNLELKKE